MPVYIRSGELDIPAPSISSVDSDDESGVFLLDPEQVVDALPQPYRMIDKVINQLLDNSWETIVTRAKTRQEEAQKIKPPVHYPTKSIEEFAGFTTMCHSGDMRYLFVAFESGEVVAFDAMTYARIAEWSIKEYSASFEYLVCKLIGPQIHLIAAVDDMGFARLLVFTNDAFFPVQLLNEQPEGSPKSNILQIDISNNCDYFGLALECEGSTCLEIYKLPRDVWLREIELAQKDALKRAQVSTESLSTAEDEAPTGPVEGLEIKFLPVTLVLRNKNPSPLSSFSMSNLQEAVEKAGIVNTVGNGSSHLLTEKHLKIRQSVTEKNHEAFMLLHQPKKNFSSIPRWHYLYPRVMQPDTSSATDIFPSVCVWWNESHLIQTYSLQGKGVKDVEIKPEYVWPMAGRVTCTAVSDCSNILAAGLDNGLVAVIDRYLGVSRALLSVGRNAAVTSMFVLDGSITSASAALFPPPAYILVQTEDGAVFLLDCNAGTSKLLLDAVRECRERQMFLVPGIPRVFLTAGHDGKAQFHDTMTGNVICDLALSFSLESPVKRLNFSFDGDILFVKNEDSTVDEIRLETLSSLSKFLASQSIKQPLVVKENIEERCQRLLNERAQKHTDRNRNLANRWRAMSKELEILLNLRNTGKSPRTISSTPSKWSRSAEKIISHMRSLD